MLRWLQTVSMPGIEVDNLTHQHLLRSMDALMDHQDAVDDCVAQLLRPLIEEDLSVVFYDLTTIRAEGHSQQDGDVRHFGMSKEGDAGAHAQEGAGALPAHPPTGSCGRPWVAVVG